MTRPETHADLDEYQRRGHTIFVWYTDLAKHPAIEQHVVKAKLEAQRMGFDITGSEITVPLTNKELAEKIAELQERYDKGLDLYAALLSGEREYIDMKYSDRNCAEFYALREDITSPDKVRPLSIDSI